MVKVTEKYLFRKFSKGSRIVPRKRGETDNEYLSRITHLYLQSQYVEEIAPLPDCTSVSVVYLQDNQLQTIHNMENFPSLTHLYLQKNRISKIDNLNCLKNLKKLYLGWNEVSVLEGLDELDNLTELHIECQTLPDGETLYFDPRTVKSLGRILKVLNIAGNNVITLRPLSGMTALEDLIANDNKIQDMDDVTETLSTLIGLKKLKLTGNPITTNRKYREALILASRSLRVLDEKDITSETRSFIQNLALSKESRPKAMPKAASDTQNARQKVPQTISGSKLFPLLKLQMMRMPRTVSSFSATVPPHFFHQSIRAFHMDVQEFRKKGKEMVDYICEYLDNLPSRRVTPNIEPGYLRPLIPPEAPEEPEDFDDIMRDVEMKIMPGVTHWQHPRFHAYFPSGNSFPSILGDMLSAGIGCIGFSWAASPACTELETIVVDWFGKAIGLPNEFLALEEGSRGGGVIQTSASECVLVCMLAARAQAIKYLKQQNPCDEEGALLPKLMAYCSRESHSCVEKAAMISFVKLRILDTDEKYRLRGETLKRAMEEDVDMGLMPFFVSTTLGTTSCCSFDRLDEIGPVCREFPHVWLHVDAAYAGNAFVCPELKPLLEGIEYADSFNTNPNKFLLTNYDCSTMWVRDRIRLTSALVVDPLYLQHGYSDAAIDYRHWGVPLSRRFRSLKLWFVLRSYGITGIRKYIRHHIKLAKKFENLVLRDPRFEVCNEVRLGLVCFRLKGSNSLNEKLLSAINGSGKLHMVPASLHETYVIRFCVVAQNATEEDIDYAWKVITEFSEELLESQALEKEPADEVMEMLDRKRKETLAYKRSFFVRMVSDPKIYNPKIAKSLPVTRHQLTDPNSAVSINAPIASWISWPLAFLLQGKLEDSNEVPVRFRHLNTMVRLKGRRESSERGDRSSPSPEDLSDSKSSPNNGKKSPKKSPLLRRKTHKPTTNQD